MTDYVKSTNFTAKDTLPQGDANKVIRGSEFDTEFNAIQTAVATKADLASPTFTGTATFAAVAGTTGTFSGAVTGSNLNISNWDTAYGYGNHASAGYLTSVAFTNINSNVTITSSETFVSNDTTLPTTATMTARILAATLGPTAFLDDLSDVNLTPAPTDGQTLVFDSSTSKFIAGTSGAGLDGGFANSTYLTAQNFNGGGA